MDYNSNNSFCFFLSSFFSNWKVVFSRQFKDGFYLLLYIFMQSLPRTHLPLYLFHFSCLLFSSCLHSISKSGYYLSPLQYSLKGFVNRCTCSFWCQKFCCKEKQTLYSVKIILELRPEFWLFNQMSSLHKF